MPGVTGSPGVHKGDSRISNEVPGDTGVTGVHRGLLEAQECRGLLESIRDTVTGAMRSLEIQGSQEYTGLTGSTGVGTPGVTEITPASEHHKPKTLFH